MKIVRERSRVALSGVLGGTLSLTLSTVIVKLIGLIYKIPIASLLTDEGMGYFNSAYTVYAFFYLLCSAGVPKAVMILISETKAEGKHRDEQKILRVATEGFLIAGSIITALFVIFSLPLAHIIGSTRSAVTMIAVAPSILFVSLGGVLRGYLSANLLFSRVAVSQLLEGVGKLAFGLAFAMVGVRLELPLEWLSAMTITGVTLGSVAGYLYLYVCSKCKITEENTRQIIYHSEKIAIIRRVLSISVPITLSAAIMSITGVIDLAMIMRSLGDIGYSESEASALYGNYTTLAVPMFNLAVAIVTPVSLAHLPILAKSHSSSDNEAFGLTERSSLDLTSGLAAPMTIGMAVFSREILSMLFPGSELEVGANLLLLISPAIIFYSLLNVTNSSLEAVGRVRAAMVSMLLGSIAKMAVGYILITRTDLGIYGAPIGTVVCYAVALFISLIIYGRTIGRTLPILSSLLAPYITAAASVICSRAVYDRISGPLNDNLALMISITLAAVIYICLITFFGILSPNKILKLAKYTKTG